MRVWIEISWFFNQLLFLMVTLHVRVWIEIGDVSGTVSLGNVTLHVRVWIEIICTGQHRQPTQSHPPREGVD